MPFLGLGFDWRKSKAHWHLLGQFVREHAVDDFRDDRWQPVLKEHPRRAIDRFLKEGLLVKGGLADQLAYKCKVGDLKEALKASGLKLSGRKEELIARLIDGNPAVAQTLASGVTVLVCSEAGRLLAEQYLAQQSQQRAEAERKSLELIRARRFKEASCVVADFEARQVFPRGMGNDWEHHNPARDVMVLTAIFQRKPGILSGLREDQWEPLRISAAMMHLWGTNRASAWLPDGFSTDLAFDNDTAARMIMFHVWHLAQLQQCQQEADVIKGVKILCVNDGNSCPTCRKYHGRTYRLAHLDKMPELPIPGCTCEMGCRCTTVAITKSWDELGIK